MVGALLSGAGHGVDQQLGASVAHVRSDTIADLLRRSAGRYPNKEAVVSDGVRITYAEFDEAVNRTANAMLARGVRAGDRLGLLARNSYAFVVTYFASSRIGSICVPINYMLSADELAYILGHAEPSALVVHEDLLHVAVEGIQRADAADNIVMRCVIAYHPLAPRHLRDRQLEHEMLGVGTEESARPSGWEPLRELMRHPNADPPTIVLPDDHPLELLYTSGTDSHHDRSRGDHADMLRPRSAGDPVRSGFLARGPRPCDAGRSHHRYAADGQDPRTQRR
jgi:fatty-acyl-CoA synthase